MKDITLSPVRGKYSRDERDRGMILRNAGAFTMVELLVATTILIILAGISFITYTGYISSARDGNRISVLGNIRSGLEDYRVQRLLPMPDDDVTVSYSGATIGYQGYAGEQVLGSIGFSDGGKDPQDDAYYTYYVGENRKYYQLLGFLETDEYLNAMITPSSLRSGLGGGIAHASDIDYSERYVYVTGDSLGVLTQSGSNTPIQELPAIIASGGLDIGTTSDNFVGHIDPETTISGDATNLAPLANMVSQGGKTVENCDDLLQVLPSLAGTTGEFTVFPSGTGAVVVTCDFSSDSLDTVSNAFEITNSLRFNSSDDTYLSRTPSQDGDRRKWTWSGWVKRSGLERTQTLFSATSGGNSNKTFFSFMSDDTLRFASDHDGGAHEIDIQTTAKFRDVSSWYHIQISVDTTASSVSIFVNGEEITGLLLSTYPSLNYETWINSQQNHYVGAFEETLGHNIENFLDGYMTEVYFIDGQALTPDSFGESQSNGKWIPKEYTGTYGTNGFHLNFSDSSILGKDTSGNAHHFSANNLDSTDQVIDTPQNNFAVWNSLRPYQYSDFSHGNLQIGNTSSSADEFFLSTIQTIGASGKYYTEHTIVSLDTVTELSRPEFIVYNSDNNLVSASYANYYGTADGRIYKNGSWVGGYPKIEVGDTVMIAADFSTGKVWFGKNSVWFGSTPGSTDGNPSQGVNPTAIISMTGDASGTFAINHYRNSSVNSNFGQGGQSGLTYYENAGGYFKYEPPIAFTALSTSNLPDSTPVYDTNTPLLIRSNTADGSTDIQDISGSAHTIQVYGDTHHTTDERKIGTTSIAFDGNGDYLQIPDSAYWDFADGDFTIDFWIYFNSLGSAGLIGQMYDSPNSNFRTTISMDATDIYFTSKNGGSNILAEYSAMHNFSTGEWYHVAAVRSGTGFSIYVNGSALPLSTITPIDSNILPDLNSDIFIGKKYGGGSDYFDGYMDEIRISKDIARWSSDFIPQSYAYNLVTGYASVIEDANAYFDVLTYAGNGLTDHHITGLNFQPDLVWIKNRDVTGADHMLRDSIRGVDKELRSNLTDSEYSAPSFFTSFDFNGFTLSGSIQDYNSAANTYVAWNWKESATSGFDIVAYIGDGVAGKKIPHNLGTRPDVMIIKNRDSVSNWPLYHQDLNGGVSSEKYRLLLDTNDVEDLTPSTFNHWNDTLPDNDFFTVGDSTATNVVGAQHVAYLFSEKPGFSKFGSYTGNGNTDGPFVYTGFKPKFILSKRVDSTSQWGMIDSVRSPYNVISDYLMASADNAEQYAVWADFLSNGFKLRGTSHNESGGTFIYMAFAEYPFK